MPPKYEPTFAILRTACGCEKRIKWPRPCGRYITVPLMFPISVFHSGEYDGKMRFDERKFELVGWRSPTEMEYKEVR